MNYIICITKLVKTIKFAFALVYCVLPNFSFLCRVLYIMFFVVFVLFVVLCCISVDLRLLITYWHVQICFNTVSGRLMIEDCWRKTNNAMAKRKRTKIQSIVDKTLSTVALCYAYRVVLLFTAKSKRDNRHGRETFVLRLYSSGNTFGSGCITQQRNQVFFQYQ